MAIAQIYRGQELYFRAIDQLLQPEIESTATVDRQLGELYLLTGQYEEDRIQFESALDKAVDADPELIGSVQLGLSEVYRIQNDRERMLSSLAAAVTAYHELGDPLAQKLEERLEDLGG